MSRGVWCTVLALVGLVGCEKPCKEGFQRYGVKCVRSLVDDAGSDNNPGADGGTDSGANGRPLDGGEEPVDPTLDSGSLDASDAPTMPDASESASSCYLDKDGDGIGAGDPLPCSDAGEPGAGKLVTAGGDCDDEDAQRSPSLSDLCGDQIDNDCDGKADNESNNACGGSCTTQLGNQPGEACSNGLLGACARAGEYVCSGTTGVVCNAASVSASSEICGDKVDNDCDGAADEPDAIDATEWFPDCDDDGFASSTVGSLPGCIKPPVSVACKSWVTTVPVKGSTQDCNDTTITYRPGYTAHRLAESGDGDHNCDGVEAKETSIRWVGTGGAQTRCEPGKTGGCGYWLDSNGLRTDTPPRCSRDLLDTFPAKVLRPDLFDYMDVMGLQFCL